MTTGHQSVKQNLATRFDICIEENGPKMNENRKKTYQFQQFAAGNQGRAGRGGGGFGRGGGVESPETIPRPHGLSDDLRLPETMKQFASTLNGGAATGPTDGFTLVGKPKPIVSPDDKKLIGIQMNRTVTGDSRIGRDDIANFFSIVESIDPNAIVFSANKNVTKPISVKRMQSMMPMDLYGFLDIKTTEWGRKDSGQRKTTLSFWLYTHVIKENIKELRQDERIQQFLSNGKCWLQPTRLTESRSRVIAYIEGKNPMHTYKTELADRLSHHLIFCKGNDKHQEIPVNIFPTRINGIPILAVAVGEKDAGRTEQMLKGSPFEDLDLIMHSWKRQDKNGFDGRIKQHAMVMQMSRAIKLADVDPNETVSNLRAYVKNSTCDAEIVDVCTAAHSAESGVCYVQYLDGHWAKVMCMLEEYLETDINEPSSRFPRQGRIVSQDPSVAPTLQSQTSVPSQTTIKVPPSKYLGKVTGPEYVPPPTYAPPPIPTKIATFSKPMMQELQDGSPPDNSDNDSTITQKTGNTSDGSNSKKTKRELKLEKENDELNSKVANLERDLARQKNIVNHLNEAMVTLTFEVKRLTSLQPSNSPKTPDVDSNKRQNVGPTPPERKEMLNRGMPPLRPNASSMDTEDYETTASPPAGVTATHV